MKIFITGMIVGTALIEPLIINVVYMRNPELFNDIILTKKNKKKLKEYYRGKGK